mmetsp:Transcript_30785/g.67385  ORF Transcript_30785/g.67385 Transcript_30785/m.67385 type:complete len:344 (-) Transcript_30785:463-1494(-)|eukprot:CAMPEP_0170592770 /NCGR_PEP_ID=MMETSP0224-20130122/13097_1 /TAXON_ID=285029 /ORGANISM="Togula jolla, Strain CCCM 725" /LENGTH=343 /DNA_ID=CAMNT_0010916689 /DNA_START=112 /DNA_END=1143 /DNA_ORIENTATION=-
MDTFSFPLNIFECAPTKLVWRSTFIDVESTLQAGPRSRASSEPATLGRQRVSTEFQDEQTYVSNLAERAASLENSAVFPVKAEVRSKKCMLSVPRRFGGIEISREAFASDQSTAASGGDLTDATSTSAEGDASSFLGSFCLTDVWSTMRVRARMDGAARHDPKDLVGSLGVGMDSADGTQSVSQGSFGHPFLCGRICAYAAAGRCLSGSDCVYCHIPHANKQLHLDKRNRGIIQAMTFSQRAALMLPILEEKAREYDFGPACESLLNLLSKEANFTRRCGPVPNKASGQKGLAGVLTAMSFQDVIRHLLLGLSMPAPSSADDIQVLLEAMRMYISSGTACDKM